MSRVGGCGGFGSSSGELGFNGGFLRGRSAGFGYKPRAESGMKNPFNFLAVKLPEVMMHINPARLASPRLLSSRLLSAPLSHSR